MTTADMMVSVGIGAAVQGSFRAAIGGSVKQLGRLRESISRMEAAQDDLARRRRRGDDRADDLAAAERRLGMALERQRARYRRLETAMTRLDTARSRRDATHRQLIGAAAGAYALRGALRRTVGAAVSFESKMADVRKVVDFDTLAQFRAMGRDILALSTRIPVAADGLGDIVAAAGQAGIARGKLLRFAEDAAKMSVAFDLTGVEAGAAMTGLRTIFGLTQDKAMDLAGAYNHLSNRMDATAPAILRIVNRVGSVGATVGMTGRDIGALAAAFLALKTPPEVAATGVYVLNEDAPLTRRSWGAAGALPAAWAVDRQWTGREMQATIPPSDEIGRIGS